MAASRNVLPLASAALAILLLSASATFAQDNPDAEATFRLVGQVVDAATGAPVLGARVSVGASEWISVTNREGRFIVPDLDPGIHVVAVEHLGYRLLATRVQATAEAVPLRLGIEADPILLEGLRVVSRRFERRRRSSGLRISEFDQEDLATSSNLTAAEMLEERIPVQRALCGGGGFECILARGHPIRPTVCIDEAPVLDGWAALATRRPHEFHMIEVYGQGGLVRAYTHLFMERASRSRFLPAAVGSC